MKSKRVDKAQVESVVRQISWYEIIPLELKDLTCYLAKRFLRKSDANNYLCRENFFEPQKFKVVKVFVG